MLNKSVFNYNPVVVRDKIMNIICDVVPFSVACSPEQNFLIAFMIGHRSLSLSAWQPPTLACSLWHDMVVVINIPQLSRLPDKLEDIKLNCGWTDDETVEPGLCKYEMKNPQTLCE